MTAADMLVQVVRDLGSDAHDARDAAHEACHAIEAGLAWGWEREAVHRAVLATAMDPATLLLHEVHARAVEQRVCRELGVPYDASQWHPIAWFETVKNGLIVPSGFFSEAVAAQLQAPAVDHLTASVLALSQVD